MSFLQKCLSPVAQGKIRKMETQPREGSMRSCRAALLARFESGEVLKATRENLSLKPVLTSGQTKQQRDYGLPTGKESLTDWKLTDQFEVPLVKWPSQMSLLCCLRAAEKWSHFSRVVWCSSSLTGSMWCMWYFPYSSQEDTAETRWPVNTSLEIHPDLRIKLSSQLIRHTFQCHICCFFNRFFVVFQTHNL